jgi:D-alanyl-D-alanine carboxypeptidase/D-alanyl-D-alanine-endopeptidase (penicillin-binding protein 4)
MKKPTSTILFTLITAIVFSQNAVEKFVSNPVFKSANISILVRDMKTGRTLFSHRPQNAAIPASTMKVITTATALEIYGADYRYETRIEHDGTISQEGVLNGNIYIVGCGDPTLGSSKMGDKDFMRKWVEAIRNAGIKKINGSIIADESRFDNEGSNPKWTWDDIGNYYAPGICALAYLDNTLRVTFKSGAIGTTPEIIDISPKIEGLTIENNLLSSKITFDSAYFYGAPRSFARSVRGEIPANKPAFVVRAELPNPGLQLVSELHQTLTSNGLIINGKPESTNQNSAFAFPASGARSKIYSHFSPPLKDIVKEANEKSNNFYTEQIFKSLALSQHQVATNNLSKLLVRNFWRSKGLDIGQLFQEDGSGLTPTNAVSAQFFVDLMQYMYQKSEHKAAFVQSLSVAGKSGTLAGILKKTPLEGKVFAKSGTIARVRCYTGYMLHDNNEWAFAVMVNNSGTNSWQTLSRIEELLVEISKGK